MRFALMISMVLAGNSVASACGNPMLWAMLFAKVPEAKVVYQAELAARARGEIEARIYEPKPGQAYHTWSKAWLMTLAEDMRPAVAGVLEPGETITILLADEVAALRFTRGAAPDFIPSGGLNAIGSFDLITTINALNGAWRHGLSYEKMMALDLASTANSASDPGLAILFSNSWISKP